MSLYVICEHCQAEIVADQFKRNSTVVGLCVACRAALHSEEVTPIPPRRIYPLTEAAIRALGPAPAQVAGEASPRRKRKSA